ncbi:RNA methyltransferase [uncultured Muribaculum sp.]|uniref:RNA methyltransferase n=1 Tax=uncultured Muribaculum sp. TaxID=1918613 RepID=UPI002598F344|nr:RNA methyltransferase [uncultured Muribaculum sp.]
MPELTNKLRKFVASLDEAKVRRESRLFVAEGTKCVLDTIENFSCRYLLATAKWLDSHQLNLNADIIYKVVRSDMERMSHFSSPPEVMAVYEIPDDIIEPASAGSLSLALDRVQDPGNLGTIIRIADWFGIRDIYCTNDTVDVYNPKVVQATMGAISRVRVHYVDLPEFLEGTEVPVYGTFLGGENIFTSSLSSGGIIVMGNEGQGISREVEKRVTRRLTIPSYPQGVATSESLNVGMATSIVVAEFRRRQF